MTIETVIVKIKLTTGSWLVSIQVMNVEGDS